MKGNIFKRTVAFTSSLAMLLTSGGFSRMDNSVHADGETPPLVMYDVNGNGIIEEGEKAYRIMSADELYRFAEMVNGGETGLNALMKVLLTVGANTTVVWLVITLIPLKDASIKETLYLRKMPAV